MIDCSRPVAGFADVGRQEVRQVADFPVRPQSSMIGKTISLVQILPLFPVSKVHAGSGLRISDEITEERKRVGAWSKNPFYI